MKGLLKSDDKGKDMSIKGLSRGGGIPRPMDRFRQVPQRSTQGWGYRYRQISERFIVQEWGIGRI